MFEAGGVARRAVLETNLDSGAGLEIPVGAKAHTLETEVQKLPFVMVHPIEWAADYGASIVKTGFCASFHKLCL